MQRVESVKSRLLLHEDGGKESEGVRGAERVDAEAKDWDEQVDGAWAPGKAPLALLTSLLALIQAHETQQAVDTAWQILEAEPNNALVQDLLGALKLQQELEREEKESDGEDRDGEDGSDDDEEEEEEEEDSDEEDEEDGDDDASDDDDGEAKDKGDKETPEEDDGAARQHEEK